MRHITLSLSRFRTCEQKFDAKFQTTGQFQTTNTPVRVVGVGFFDFHHGQNGVAPNLVELHPVLDVTFNQWTATTGLTRNWTKEG